MSPNIYIKMDDPIKIIWKYKNNNRRIQYHMYIFIGKAPEDILKIINKIADLNLYDSLVTLSKVELKRLVDFYGDYWYQKLFNIYHINYIISLVKESPAQKRELTEKLGKEWLDMHVEKHVIMERKLLYNYETLIRDERVRKTVKKGRAAAVVEDETDLDYTTHAKDDLSKIFDVRSKLRRQDRAVEMEGEANMKRTDVSETSVDEAIHVPEDEDDYEVANSPEYEKNVVEEKPFVDQRIVREFSRAMRDFDERTDVDPALATEEEKIYELEEDVGPRTLVGGEDDSDSDSDSDCEGCEKIFKCNGCKNDFSCHNQKPGSKASQYYHECEGAMCDYLYKCLDCGKIHRFHEKDEQEGGDAESNESAQSPESTENLEQPTEYDEGADTETLMTDEEMDMETIEKLYKEEDVTPDDEVEKTSNLIKKALHDDALFEKKIAMIIDFDTSKDGNMYDENLKDIYKKFYITEQYIFRDDTVKVIKDKICCSIRNNIKFDKDSYVMPSRQYLWSEYYFNNKIEKIMVGQKWIRRNELLNVDVEPNTNIRYYEELRSNLRLLRDNIRRYGNKIRREDDDNNILFDYEGYIMNNELYMIDIYNEFGLAYNPNSETIKNLIDVYIRLYFPKIKGEDMKYIIEYLGTDKKIEASKMLTTFEIINNDLIMTNEIMSVVESVRISDQGKIFKDTFITQSVIHVNLRIVDGKIDLYRIFNEFEPTDKYPFLQYQTPDGTIFFKFKEEDISFYLKNKENADILSKWFENSPYGISFKVKISDKNDEDRFTAINLNETGRIEYKTQWKEDDMATIEDIRETYNYVRDLIKKINTEKNKVKVDIPEDNEFKYAFINTIQKFDLPGNFVVNHNDLSEFARYFYPYVALVIEPRKRQAKIQKGSEKSKFGTYLRYKRVSKYENQQRLEQRIMYFMRNYEYSDQLLANEISKQFNITEDRAMEEIEKVRQRYPNIKRSRKFLKKLENIPKYKPPGIGIDVQGKQREKYKIRISGARDKKQLDRIIGFMNILIYLYIETYLYKKPERQNLKEKLKILTHIARRRNKVDEIVYYSKEIKTVKQMTQIDKRRIGFKPEKGQNQWTRSCQNSGNDKKRRPFSTTNMDELIKKGYSYNKKTGAYEHRVIVKGRSGKGKEITLKTIKLSELDENGNATGNDIHYACGPEENGDHMYVGFLTRSSNPHGYCMPCCFKKDPAISKNKEKRDFFWNCMGQTGKIEGEESKVTQKALGDKLYILQDTNKIQEGRFGFLPKYLDFYFNTMLDKQKKIRHHYLVKTDTGYFFKYGSKQDEFQFLNTLASLLDTTVIDLKEKVILSLEQDRNDLIFTSLNNGDIKTQFSSRDKYIEFIKYNAYLDFDIMNYILSIPGVIEKHGLNILVFQKQTIIIKRTLEKEKIKEDFFLLCQNIEDKYSLVDPQKKTIFMLKENRNYYPIVLVHKDNELTKTMTLTKTFKWEDSKKNIVSHIKDFYERNCYGTFFDELIHKNTSITARETYHLLTQLNNKVFMPKYQVIDVRNKCKYLITNGNLIVTVRPSGSIYDLQIVKSIDKYIDNFESTLKKLSELYDKSEKKLPIKPLGVYFDTKSKSKYRVTAILTKSRGNVPVIPEFVEGALLEQHNLIIENKPLYDKIDKELEKGKGNYIVDERIGQVNYDKYFNESYELFRLTFSDYMNRPENLQLRSNVEQIVVDPGTEKQDKIHKLRLFLYKLIDKDLYERYKKVLASAEVSRDTLVDEIEKVVLSAPESPKDKIDDVISSQTEEPLQPGPILASRVERLGQNFPIKITPDTYDTTVSSISTIPLSGGRNERLIYYSDRLPNLTNYQINNDRNICEILPKDQCTINPHCHWTHSGCFLSLTNDMIITFVNKISEELGSNDLKALELLKIGNYFVSDIVDYNRFTERPGQKIIRSSSNTIKKVLNDLFGRENIPKIGKRRGAKGLEVNYQQMNIDNPLKDMRDMYVQHIIDNNLSIFRAYVNGYYWLKHPYYNIESRNLGFYSPTQTELSNYFRSLVIDWLQDKKYKKLIETELIQYMDHKRSSKDPINDFIIKIGTDVNTLTNCIIELYALNKIQHIPILVYDENNVVIYILDNGLKYHFRDNKSMTKTEISDFAKDNEVLQIRFSFVGRGQSMIPDEIEVLYNRPLASAKRSSLGDIPSDIFDDDE
ncbi:MAG: early transcription factor VETF large subunit [Hyperionvirus sp.]|uniref:Early transcription factor VETF large subunit n=1 Tax=Hyperionvirus sp. TaxID=2487770 RepID=A0A3G5AAT9_9VIRU|nr:MAG: early transcription factor VETF large subunit [Hyperionvirus sp.]